VRVLTTGCEGQLGRELRRALQDEMLQGTDLRTDSGLVMDITSYESTVSTIAEFEPEVVIHAAAYTNVDGCERDPETAYQVNGLGTQNVALACQRIGCAMVYVSTDYVFDGDKGEPYYEFDRTNPVSAYGRSKLAGEQYVQTLTNKFYIVRTAWLYSAHGSNFIKWALKSAREQPEIMGVTDQVGSPTHAADLADGIAQMIRRERYGIYHLTNEGSCSRYELLLRILDFAGLKARVAPVTTPELLAKFSLPAKRPANAALRNFCASRSMGITLRPWDDALKELVCSLR
jgi:dTDP-4-dehydrorhamnose reductase